ncbi:MAG: aspartate/glutamate racemase family protein [Desulfobacterales bacterium]|jgi:aspartate racemase
MKTIGLLGGMSWESTASYYRILNEEVRRRLGGLHSAKICLFSVAFAEIEALMRRGDWGGIEAILSDAARKVEAGGSDFFLICTNTIHHIAPAIEKSVRIPLLHIADAAAEALTADGIRRVGLIGTRFTMEEHFFSGRLSEKYGIEVAVPPPEDRGEIHRIIFEELCMGRILDASRDTYLRVIDALAAAGAEAVILGCTEIALLVDQEDTAVPLYDTTTLHGLKAVDIALSQGKP